MEDINNWIITMSVISVAAGVIVCLIPKSKLKKTYSVLIGVLILYTVALPFMRSEVIDFSLKEILSMTDDISEQFSEKNDDLIIQAAITGIENAIKSKLDEDGLVYGDIKVKCSATDDNITVYKVTVYESKESDKNAITNIIKDCIGNEATINFIKGEEDG
ncbi:MAG: hypothetical protein NC122_03235 [Faecalibacterium sp.]|nr:hypothetical protein [Ruminococcus sp.]MCM1392730.1 hypothetical protein [Ruminococcus sp.]MCM1485200.1 hypothetical protein [Faecalibacterium sp.]